jgi:hypothetical protein
MGLPRVRVTMQGEFSSVDDYIDSQPETVRGQLELVRAAIRKAIPGGGGSYLVSDATYTSAGAGKRHESRDVSRKYFARPVFFLAGE